MWPENALLVALIKIGGPVSGAILALVFQPPKTRAEFVTRSVFSVMSGLLFSEPAREWLKWADTWQMGLSAGALTALASWWIWGATIRIIGAWKPKE